MAEEKDGRTPDRNRELSAGRLAVTLVLLAAVLVSGIFCARAAVQYCTLHAQYRSAVCAAGEMLAAAEAERAGADPESEANVEKRRQTSEDMIEAAKAEIARIERHSAELDAAVREAGSKIDALEGSADYDYYRSIYGEYVEGRAYVEELLSKD